MMMKKSYLTGCDANESVVMKHITRYVKTESGKSWRKTEEEKEWITAEQYCNIVDAVPFFRGIGGKEIVSKGYTYYGYIPVRITSISPSRDAKHVYEFSFIKNA